MSAIDRYRRRPDVIVQTIQDDTVLLNPNDGQYFALDSIGSRIWELCDGSLTVKEIASSIHQEFDAPIDVIEADVNELLAELINEKLVVQSA